MTHPVRYGELFGRLALPFKVDAPAIKLSIDYQPVYSLLRHIFFTGGWYRYPSQPELSDSSGSLSATAALCRNT